jgi:hypothetical protein
MIQSGVEIPYQEASSSGATSTSFKEAVLSLEVTPQITPDDRIIMKLTVNQDTSATVFEGVPSINTNEIQTQVLVDNAQTIVLGGIFTTDRNFSTTKTPFLGDLPYIGRAFRRTVERDDKQELLDLHHPEDHSGLADPLSPHCGVCGSGYTRRRLRGAVFYEQTQHHPGRPHGRGQEHGWAAARPGAGHGVLRLRP